MSQQTDHAASHAPTLRRVVLLVLLAGCNAPLDVLPPPDDGPAAPDFSLPATTNDMPLPGVGDMPSNADIAMPPGVGKMLAGHYLLDGITSDDQVVAVNLDNNALIAVPVGGKNATTISAGPWFVSLRGRAVFDWEGMGQPARVAKANVWTAAAGVKALPDGASSIAGIAGISPDGNWIYYSGNAQMNGSATDLYVARWDTTGSVRYAIGALNSVTNDPTACSSFGLFTTTNKLLSIVCGQGNVLEVVDPANGQVTRLSGNVDNWMVADPLGRYAAAGDPDHKLSLFPLDGSAPIAIDTGVKPGQAAFLPDGSALVYVTDGRQLKRASVGNAPVVTTLVQANVSIIRRSFLQHEPQPAISPDGQWVVITSQFDAMTGGGDLLLASTSKPGAPVTLVAAPAGDLLGEAFTHDSRYVLFYSDAAVSVGNLNAMALAGGPATRIATRTWVSYSGVGNLVACNDNFHNGRYYGRADLKFVDVTNPLLTKPVAAQAEVDYFPTRDRKTFVYSTTTAPATSGIYSVLCDL